MAKVLNKEICKDDKGQYVKFSMSNHPYAIFMCDIEDFPILESGRNFCTSKVKKRYYLESVNKVGFPNISFHRKIMNMEDKPMSKRHRDLLIVDHIDNNSLNNRKYNLQVITLGENVRKDRPKPLIPLSGEVKEYISRFSGMSILNSIDHEYGIVYLKARLNSKYIACSRDFLTLQNKINKLLFVK